LAAAKALKDAGIPFDCYEKRDCVGGLWAFDADPNACSAAYRGLNSNVPKTVMCYEEYPMGKAFPFYPSHWDFARYFNDYAEHFGLLEHIELGTAVEHVEERAAEEFEVRLSDGRVKIYTDVVVANGHHWCPKWPQPAFPGSFNGVQMHSHNYRDATDWVGKRILVVGMGNSAMDIAVEASDVAEAVFLSARSGVHILPKAVFGVAPAKALMYAMSSPTGRRVVSRFVRWYQGSPEKWGLPKPTHALGDSHPTMSNRIGDRLMHGRVKPKPNIAELLGDKVSFIDGTVEEIDVIVYCTGYWVSFPFFDREYISAPDNEIHPFLQVALPDRPGVWFVGLLQPLGSIQPAAEAQSKWIADLIAGHARLPSEPEMRRDIERDREGLARRYVKSTRNTLQVDHVTYMRKLRKEHRAGLQRAEARPPYVSSVGVGS
jgi:cation diffusion facilitator CzcD-associated flavoprotein CzcO